MTRFAERSGAHRGTGIVIVLAFSLLVAWACGPLHGSDEVDLAKIPPDLRDDYALFAQRCSKCHSLARPLGSGIDDDEYWRRYVERMRRQPSSGISPEDEPPILRFLHYFSEQEKKKKGERL